MMSNDKILLLISFSLGIFINMGSIYIIIILAISNYDKLKVESESLIDKYLDFVLAFIGGVLIQQIYIPFFLLSIFLGFLLKNDIKNMDSSKIKENIILLSEKILSVNYK